MHNHTTEIHAFGERRTAFVVLITFCVMLAEMAVGFLSGSMALLAEGAHMGSHVLVLCLNWGAYILVRRLEKRHSAVSSERILHLAAYTSGLLLLLMSVFIVAEGVERLLHPEVDIAYGQALAMAAVGFATNLTCAWVLHGRQRTSDLNIHAAYLHILSDVITDFGAILGLLCALLWNITYIDAAVALICALVVVRWAVKLLIATGKQLTQG